MDGEDLFFSPVISGPLCRDGSLEGRGRAFRLGCWRGRLGESCAATERKIVNCAEGTKGILLACQTLQCPCRPHLCLGCDLARDNVNGLEQNCCGLPRFGHFGGLLSARGTLV